MYGLFLVTPRHLLKCCYLIITHREKEQRNGGDWQVNQTKRVDSDGGSSGYNSGKGLISPDEQPRSHKDKIAAMSKQAFQTTDFRTIAGQSPKV